MKVVGTSLGFIPKRIPLTLAGSLLLFGMQARGADDPGWNSAVELLKNGQSASAIQAFEDWNTRAESRGQRSPEAHHNLALAYWNEKRPDEATYHLIRSAQIRLGIRRAWDISDRLSDLQKEIGIRDAVSDDVAFRVFLVVNRSWLCILGCLAIWSALSGYLFRRGLGRPTAIFLFCFSWVATCFAAIAYLNQTYLSRYGVLTSPDPIPLSSSPRDLPEAKLADLPVGTLVRIAERSDENAYTRISGPVAGWVPRDKIRPVPVE